MLRIEITTDNSAFGDGPRETCAESARILRVIAGEMDAEHLSGTVRDVNGNCVGWWEITGD